LQVTGGCPEPRRGAALVARHRRADGDGHGGAEHRRLEGDIGHDFEVLAAGRTGGAALGAERRGPAEEGVEDVAETAAEEASEDGAPTPASPKRS
jgi:hypothetical protein